MSVQVADRLPARIVHIQFQFPFPFCVANGPECDAAGEYLRHDKGRAGVRHMGTAGEQLAVEVQRGLATIDEADIDEGFAIFVSQRRIQQAGIKAAAVSRPFNSMPVPAGCRARPASETDAPLALRRTLPKRYTHPLPSRWPDLAAV